MTEVYSIFIAILLCIAVINIFTPYLMELVEQDVVPHTITMCRFDYRVLCFIAFVTSRMSIGTSEDGTYAYLYYGDKDIPRVRIEIKDDAY